MAQGDTLLDLSAQRAELGVQLDWNVPEPWADGEEENGEVDRFVILRGPSPDHLATASTIPGDARTFDDEHALLHGAAWYQVVALDGNETLIQSDRVLAGPT